MLTTAAAVRGRVAGGVRDRMASGTHDQAHTRLTELIARACSDDGAALRMPRPLLHLRHRRHAHRPCHPPRRFRPYRPVPARRKSTKSRGSSRTASSPAASSSSNRATSTGLDTLSPAVTSPHAPGSPTPFRPCETDTDHRAAAQPPKDQKCRSQGSGTGRGVPPHDSCTRYRNRPTAVTSLLLNTTPPAAKPPWPDMPSLTSTH